MPEVNLDLDTELDIEAKLVEICKTDHVNMINLSNALLPFQMKVLVQGHLLSCADHILLADFIAVVIKRFCDFAPDLEAIYKDYDVGLKVIFE